MISTFTSRHPYVTIQVEEKGVRDIIEHVRLSPESIGAIVNINDLYSPLLNDDFVYFPIEDINLAVYTAKCSPFAQHHKTTSLKALNKKPLVIYKPNAIISPIEDIIQQLGFCNITCSVSNLLAFHAILQEGQHITIGTYSKRTPPIVAEHLTAIPIRDKINYSGGPLIQRKALENPVVLTFVHYIFELCNLYWPLQDDHSSSPE